MTLANKPVPGYLNPTEFEQATVHVIYEPPIFPGITIRVKRFDTSACTAAGDETVVIKGLASDWRERHDGSSEELPYAYGLWDTHEEPHISDISQLLEHCDREGIADPVAYVQTDSGKNWLTGGHRIGDLRKLCLDRGAFRSALIGGILVPVVYETIRTQTMPVLGWSLESAAQTSFKGSSQFVAIAARPATSSAGSCQRALMWSVAGGHPLLMCRYWLSSIEFRPRPVSTATRLWSG